MRQAPIFRAIFRSHSSAANPHQNTFSAFSAFSAAVHKKRGLLEDASKPFAGRLGEDTAVGSVSSVSSPDGSFREIGGGCVSSVGSPNGRFRVFQAGMAGGLIGLKMPKLTTRRPNTVGLGILCNRPHGNPHQNAA